MADPLLDSLGEAAVIGGWDDRHLFEELRAALDGAGLPVGLNSRPPFDVVDRFVRDHVVPRVRAAKEAFVAEFQRSRGRLEAAVAEAVRRGAAPAGDALLPLRAYLDECAAEGLAGPKTASLIIAAATADALQAVLTAQQPNPLAVLRSQDWLMVGFFYIRFVRRG